MERLQVLKLRLLLRHCERNVPFYRDVIRGAAIDVEGIQSLRVLEQFPVIDKSIVKRSPQAFTSSSEKGFGPLRMVHTGGTTGEPLRFYKDAGLRSSSHGALYRFHDWMGVSAGDPKIVVWGAPIVPAGLGKVVRDWGLRLMTNSRHINPFTINPAAKDDLIRLFKKHQPVLVHGYCQAIYELARLFEQWGFRWSLRAVSTTVEPLFEEYRTAFRSAFQCEAFDQYGCGEVEVAAGECSAHEGLHVFQERTVLELDGDGAVILTDLDNRAFPFIRYRNGDLAELSDAPCSCGRIGPLLRRVLGRTGDVVTGPNGNRVHPEFFTHLINELGLSYSANLRKYQVVQDRTDHLVWKMVADRPRDDELQRLVSKVREYLGSIDVELVFVDDIPPARSGKFRYVISGITARS
jgi:phenylacetate-CoA ligase